MIYIIPIVLIILGLVSKFFPPQKENWFYGYRSKRSKRDEESWDIAQASYANYLLLAGVVSLILYYIGQEYVSQPALSNIILISPLFLCIIGGFRTEQKLMEKQDRHL